jgi:membrane associated rhomboid family serine protease
MALFQENRSSREPFLNAPVSVLWLIGVLLATHAARVLAPGPWPDMLIAEYGFTPARFAAAFAGQPLTPGMLAQLLVSFVSYIFLHADLTHVGINSLWLLAFGPIVARRLGTAKFLLFFFACGVAAVVLHLAVYWNSEAPVVGASGAISGLMGGGIRILYGRMHAAPGRTRGALAPVTSRPIIGFSLVWAGINVVSGLARLGVTDDLAVVAWVAHLGGYFFGLAIIGYFDRLVLRRAR